MFFIELIRICFFDAARFKRNCFCVELIFSILRLCRRASTILFGFFLWFFVLKTLGQTMGARTFDIA